MSQFGSAQLTAAFIDLATGDNVDAGLYGGEQAISYLTRDIKKSSWITQIPVPLRAESSNSANPSWKAARSADFMTKAWMRWATPAVSINPDLKDEAKNYRIAWTYNLGHNVIKKGALMFNDLELQTFDRYWLDMHATHFTQEGKLKLYNQMIGNVPALVEFSDSLPSENIMTPQPYYFAGATSNALALCCLSLNDVRFVYDLESDLSKLLRVQKFNKATKQWEDFVPGSMSSIVKVQGQSDFTLKMPEFWAQYVIVTNDEREYHTGQERDVVIEQVQKYDSIKKQGSGTVKLDFHFNYPVKALFWNAVNTTAEDLHNFSNYTTDASDADSGSDPVTHVSLFYENNPRCENVPADHFSMMESWNNLPVGTMQTGYHSLVYALDITSPDGTGSTNYSKLSVSLTNQIADVAGNYYKVVLRALTINIFRMSQGAVSFPSFL